MAPLLDIDTSTWPTSGTADESSTGLYALGSGWTHGVDANGRHYIEHANGGGSDQIQIINPASIFGSSGDRCRVAAGIMIALQATIDYANLGTNSRITDTNAGERAIVTLDTGTDYYGGEQFRFRIDEYGPTATETQYPDVAGYEFDQVYEVGMEYLYDSPGWFRIYMDGMQVGVVQASNMETGPNPDKITYWTFPDVTNDRVRYRLYGDRDGHIRAWDDDYAVRPRTDLQTVANRMPIDQEVETSDTERNYWRVSSGAAYCSAQVLTSGGINPGRYKMVVTGGSAVILSVDSFDQAGDPKRMILENGILINAGGSLAIEFFSTMGVPTSLIGGVRFDGSGNLQTKQNAVASWTTVGSYSEGVYYTLRINRARSGDVLVSLEDMTNDFKSSATIATWDSGLDDLFGTDIAEVRFTADECEFEMLVGCDIDHTGGVSSFAGTDLNAVTPAREVPNKVWAQFPRPNHVRSLPGGPERIGLAAGKPWVVSTVGRSGNNITDFVNHNLAALTIFQQYAGELDLIEWMVNDFYAVRASEANTITARDAIYAAVVALIDFCCLHNIYLAVGAAIPYPTGGSSNWQSYTLDAVAYLNTAVRAYMLSKGRPDVLRWAAAQGDVDTYYATDGSGGSTGDDIHFTSAGDEQYAADFLSVIASIGTKRSRRWWTFRAA